VPGMERSAGRLDRRQNPRHPISSIFDGKELPITGTSNQKIRGRLHDISTGGICLMTNRPVKVSGLIRGSFVLSGAPVGVPSLMRVCWVQRHSKGARYRVGMQFLL